MRRGLWLVLFLAALLAVLLAADSAERADRWQWHRDGPDSGYFVQDKSSRLQLWVAIAAAVGAGVMAARERP